MAFELMTVIIFEWYCTKCNFQILYGVIWVIEVDFTLERERKNEKKKLMHYNNNLFLLVLGYYHY